MKNYEIISVANRHVRWIVIATSYISPISRLDDLARDIHQASGVVLFDLILINGLEDNRYISAELKDGSFVRKSFKKEKVVSDDLRDISRTYFKEHPDTVDEGTISRTLKQRIKLGAI